MKGKSGTFPEKISSHKKNLTKKSVYKHEQRSALSFVFASHLITTQLSYGYFFNRCEFTPQKDYCFSPTIKFLVFFHGKSQEYKNRILSSSKSVLKLNTLRSFLQKS